MCADEKIKPSHRFATKGMMQTLKHRAEVATAVATAAAEDAAACEAAQVRGVAEFFLFPPSLA